MIFDAHVL